jgi:hypothetical protein
LDPLSAVLGPRLVGVGSSKIRPQDGMPKIIVNAI